MIRRSVLIAFLFLFLSTSSIGLAASLSEDLLVWLDNEYALDQTVDIVVQIERPLTEKDREYLLREATNLREYEMLPMLALTIPARELPRWAAHPAVRSISKDRVVKMSGHRKKKKSKKVDTTVTDSRASLIQQATGVANLGLPKKIRWRNFHVAVLDSGAQLHSDLYFGYQWEVLVDTQESGDTYGHGTHVAGIITGDGYISSFHGKNYSGIAPNVPLMSVRVLDDEGRGRISTVLAGLDWLLITRDDFNTRVINLSLGAAAVESYKTDPLCQATKYLYEAGITVVTSAGNLGRSPDGRPLYGTITSPGNSPWVITVGASDDRGTARRSDDTIAGFSSRGPTRSYDSLADRYDHLVKPDLVAPGRRIVAPAALGAWMAQQNPDIEVDRSEYEQYSEYYRLSGTSMSSAIVTGIVAHLIQKNPSLTPAEIKAILMYTAQMIPGYSVLDQGAGLVNAEGAVRLAKAFRKGKNRQSGTIVKPSQMPKAVTKIAGESFAWAQGRILTRKEGVSGLVEAGGILFAEGILFADGIVFGDGILFADGIIFADGILFGERSVLGEGIVFIDDAVRRTDDGWIDASGVIFADAAALGNGDLLSDSGTTIAQGILFADGVLFADSIADPPAGMTSAGNAELAEGILFADAVLVDVDSLEHILDANSVAAEVLEESKPVQ